MTGFRRKKGCQGETARKKPPLGDSDGFLRITTRGDVSPRLIKPYRPLLRVKEGLAGGPPEAVACSRHRKTTATNVK